MKRTLEETITLSSPGKVNQGNVFSLGHFVWLFFFFKYQIISLYTSQTRAKYNITAAFTHYWITSPHPTSNPPVMVSIPGSGGEDSLRAIPSYAPERKRRQGGMGAQHPVERAHCPQAALGSSSFQQSCPHSGMGWPQTQQGFLNLWAAEKVLDASQPHWVLHVAGWAVTRGTAKHWMCRTVENIGKLLQRMIRRHGHGIKEKERSS